MRIFSLKIEFARVFVEAVDFCVFRGRVGRAEVQKEKEENIGGTTLYEG